MSAQCDHSGVVPAGAGNSNASSGASEERRLGRRRRVFLSGKIVYGDFAIHVDCTVRDLSEGGAKVLLGSPDTSVPARCHLLDVGKKTIIPVRVAWRRGAYIGFEFAGDAEDVRGAKDARVRRLASF